METAHGCSFDPSCAAITDGAVVGHGERQRRAVHPDAVCCEGRARTKPPLRLRILGTFEAMGVEGPVELPRGQLRWLLASFCLEPGRLLPEYRLIEQVWGSEGGSTSALRSSVSRLRTWFGQFCSAGAVEITHRGTGYAMTLPDGMLDATEALRRFDLSGHLDDDDAVNELLSIVSLWRAPVLADAPWAVRHHPATVELDHLRGRSAIALAAKARAIGRAEHVIDSVRQAAWDAPFDERLQASFLAVALAAGRRAEALAHYEAVCRRIRTELGVEPSPALHALVSESSRGGRGLVRDRATVHTIGAGLPSRRVAWQAALPGPGPTTATTAATAVIPSTVCRLVPPPVAADFTGRATALRRIVAAILNQERRTTVYVSGAPGIGKTELCLAATAQIGTSAEDRVLFASMEGSSGRPRSPYAVMGRFVRALRPGTSVDSDDPHALANQYRSLLADEPTLIVLDDVAGADQVVPFLTADPRCSVLANGRAAAPAIPGCVRLELCAFTQRESEDFVTAIIGQRRATSDPEALRRLHLLVDGHPTGLRIAALRLASNPHWSLRRLTDVMAEPSTLLDVLEHDGLSIRRLIADIVGQREPELRRALERIARVGAAAPAGSAVIDRGAVPEVTDEVLDQLHGAQLIHFLASGPAPARIWLSNLVRSYAAAERAVLASS